MCNPTSRGGRLHARCASSCTLYRRSLPSPWTGNGCRPTEPVPCSIHTTAGTQSRVALSATDAQPPGLTSRPKRGDMRMSAWDAGSHADQSALGCSPANTQGPASDRGGPPGPHSRKATRSTSKEHPSPKWKTSILSLSTRPTPPQPGNTASSSHPPSLSGTWNWADPGGPAPAPNQNTCPFPLELARSRSSTHVPAVTATSRPERWIPGSCPVVLTRRLPAATESGSTCRVALQPSVDVPAKSQTGGGV